MTEISQLLVRAQQGDKAAEAKLIVLYEPLINKYAKRYANGFIDEDCKQQLIVAFILAVRRFDLNRYQ